MISNYIPEDIEKFVQDFWNNNKLFLIDETKKKKNFFCLSMFPYPSGKLHIGHIRNYTIGDIIARYKIQEGYYVLNPIGWDSFGIPAENAAFQRNISPKNWTEQNIACMKIQLKRLGFSFDWSREITTSNKEYYKWEQLFFIKLYKSGLVYKKKTFINWDPIDKTVLANEQVIDGKGWRSGYPVERKKISQWFLKITSYANELILGLKNLSGWPAKVKGMQKNWINKKIGYNIISNTNTNHQFKFFLDRLDLLPNIKFILISQEHELFEKYSITDKFKKFDLEEKTDLYIVNPINNDKIPIWITNKKYKSSDYLYNLGIPSNYNNDYKFAKKYNIKTVQKNIFYNIKKKILIILFFKILKEKKIIKKLEIFNIKDWCISRQRYWGTPIPIVYCSECGIVTEEKKNLPIILPDIKEHNYTNILLGNIENFINTKCPTCNNYARRETDTFDTFFESSWYYIKYISYKNSINSDNLDKWLPVNQYIGGIEHATLHLIYARFFHKLMKDFKIVTCDEPFKNLLTQGMVLMDGSKMSKSKGNIIDQSILIKKYGADALRLFITFAAPPEQSFEWNENGMLGCKKFLERVWIFTNKLKDHINVDNNLYDKTFQFEDKNIEIINTFNDILEKINFNIKENHAFNVVVALLMSMYKLLGKLNINKDEDLFITNKILHALLIILSPISPHITHYLWSKILKKNILIINEKFPNKIDNINLKKNIFNLIIQVNGKFKTILKLSKNKNKQNVINYVLENDRIKNIILNKKIKNIIYKEFKIINIVTNK